MYAGLAGALFALAFGRIVPDSFGFVLSIEFLVMVVLGGLGSIRGAIAGAFFVTALPQVLNHYSDSLRSSLSPAAPDCSLRRRACSSAPRSSPSCSSPRTGSPAHPRSGLPSKKESTCMSRIVVILASCIARRCGLVLAACGSKGDDPTGPSATAALVKTGPGVTAKTISLGVLTDTSGVFAGAGGPLSRATSCSGSCRTRKGGVCGRQVELIVKDHGYDPQKGVSLYREIEPNVLASSSCSARRSPRRCCRAPEGRHALTALGVAVAADGQRTSS